MSGFLGEASGFLGEVGGNLFSMLFHIGTSKIGYLTLDVLVSESLDLPSEVTKYPVESGDEDITDHITSGNEELTISGAIASGSAFGIEFGILCYSKMIDAIDQMRKMHKERKTFTVITGLGKYEEMAFTKLSLDRNNSPQVGGQWLTINATLRKIKKVSLKQADLPPDQVGGEGGGSGNAKGKAGATDKKVSTGGEKSPATPLSRILKHVPGATGSLPSI